MTPEDAARMAFAPPMLEERRRPSARRCRTLLTLSLIGSVVIAVSLWCWLALSLHDFLARLWPTPGVACVTADCPRAARQSRDGR